MEKLTHFYIPTYLILEYVIDNKDCSSKFRKLLEQSLLRFVCTARAVMLENAAKSVPTKKLCLRM